MKMSREIFKICRMVKPGVSLYRNTQVTDNFMAILGLVVNVALLLAVRTSPREIAALSPARP